jgi:HPt (histidine-containing phosphotransfer) domain-containing protein
MEPPPDDLPILDPEHLRRQSAGDGGLEAELLALFEAQCARLRPLLADGRPALERADTAHTLKGSARAVGAWRLGAMADLLETALRSSEPDAAATALLPGIDAVVETTRRAVVERLRAA